MPLSGWPSVIEKNGIASTSSSATAEDRPRPRPRADLAAPAGERRLLVLLLGGRRGPPGLLPRRLAGLVRRTLAASARTFDLDTPMKAGTRVSAASIVTATTSAAARPSAPTNATSEMYRPRMETTTVLPATTMAAPEVPSAAGPRR